MAVAEAAKGATDDIVLDLAFREQRVLLTEDKDFGQLVYAAAKETSGVIFIRFPATARTALSQAVVDLVNTQGQRLAGCFVVVQPSRIRISRSPAP